MKLLLSPYAIYAGRARSAYALDAPDNSPADAVVVDNDGNVGIGTASPAEKLSVSGVVETTTGVRFPDGTLQTTAVTADGGVPRGGIIMWSGAIADVPSGWALCDGNNGTPNLTDKFVICADKDSGGIRNVGETGGAHTHRLTVDEMPSHTHDVKLTWFGEGDQGNGQSGTGVWAAISRYSQVGKHTGGGQAHNNMPQYYALAFILKL